MAGREPIGEEELLKLRDEMDRVEAAGGVGGGVEAIVERLRSVLGGKAGHAIGVLRYTVVSP
jgi:hypothetical protein